MPSERIWNSRSLELALLMLGAVGLLLVVVDWGILVAASTEGVTLGLLAAPVTALLYLVTGLLFWRRRRHNRLGAILVLGGFFVVLGTLSQSDLPVVVAVGLVFTTAPLAIIPHLLLAFPSGRVPTRAARAVVGCGYAVCLVLQAPLYLFDPSVADPQPLLLADRPDLLAAGRVVQSVAGLLVMGATTVLLVRRVRAATPRQRRILVPLDAFGMTIALLLPLAGIVLGRLDLAREWVGPVQLVMFILVPLVFTWCARRGGFMPAGEIDALAVRLGTWGGDRSDVDAAIAEALGDPSVEVAYVVGEGRLVDRTGAERPALDDHPGRGHVPVEIQGRPVAWILYDRTLLSDAAIVESAGRVAAIALDRERLVAELVVRSRELGESRARLVETADLERRRIAGDLHDGLQAQLVVLALRAGLLTEGIGATPELVSRATQLRRDLDGAAADLRRLVHGLMPALLVERGLYAATEDLVALTPLPTDLTLTGSDAGLPDPVSSAAYYVVAESLTNALKHSDAGRLSVLVARTDTHLTVEVADDGSGGAVVGGGAGLRGLTDRIDGLGGRLVVDSRPTSGTRILAEVPCVP